MPAAAQTAFDVAFWFSNRARSENRYLQPQALQRLLFLAQAWFASLSQGALLMPAVFVADEVGPIEPNLHAAHAWAQPEIDDDDASISGDVASFLERVWQRFGHLSAEALGRLTTSTSAYRDAFGRGSREIISNDALKRSIDGDGRVIASPVVSTPAIEPQVLRTQDGRAVTAMPWMPGARPGSSR